CWCSLLCSTPLSRTNQPGDGVGGLFHLRVGGVPALGHGSRDAVREMLLEQADRHRLQSLRSRGDLGEDVNAVAVLFDHPLQAADLAFYPAQPLQVILLVRGVPVSLHDSSIPLWGIFAYPSPVSDASGASLECRA